MKDPSDPTYYDRPVLKEPVWIWAVPAYFYVGGTAGAAAVLGAAAQSFDPRGLGALVKRCRLIAAGGAVLSTGLLIYDLGRPERFLNMLRVIRPTSPMSVGSWTLAATGPLMGMAALLADSRGWLRRAGNLAGLGAGVGGMVLAGYPSVLLSTTAVPAWQEARRSLPALFIASGISGAATLAELGGLDRRQEAVVHRFGLVGKVAELASMAAMSREVSRIERVGRAYREGAGGWLLRLAKGLTVASLGLSLVPGRAQRAPGIKAVTAALAGTAGAMAYKFGVFHAGKTSARDPRATFHLQRSARQAKEVTHG